MFETAPQGSIAVLDGGSSMLRQQPSDQLMFGIGFFRRSDMRRSLVLLVPDVAVHSFQSRQQAPGLRYWHRLIGIAVEDSDRYQADALGERNKRIRGGDERIRCAIRL